MSNLRLFSFKLSGITPDGDISEFHGVTKKTRLKLRCELPNISVVKYPPENIWESTYKVEGISLPDLVENGSKEPNPSCLTIFLLDDKKQEIENSHEFVKIIKLQELDIVKYKQHPIIVVEITKPPSGFKSKYYILQLAFITTKEIYIGEIDVHFKKHEDNKRRRGTPSSVSQPDTIPLATDTNTAATREADSVQQLEDLASGMMNLFSENLKKQDPATQVALATSIENTLKQVKVDRIFMPSRAMQQHPQ